MKSPSFENQLLGQVMKHLKLIINIEIDKKFDERNFQTKTHNGWNDVQIKKNIFNNKKQNLKMYFNHSYYPVLNDNENIVAETNFQNKFTSIFSKDNIFGIQPHPEKSQEQGHPVGVFFFFPQPSESGS